jgi:hypothetical protein
MKNKIDEKWEIEDKKRKNRKPRRQGDREKGRKEDDKDKTTELEIG